MPAFTEKPYVQSYEYLNIKALRMKCVLNYHEAVAKVAKMNERGKDGILYCPGMIPQSCPCKSCLFDIANFGECDSKIFKKL